MSQKTSGVSRRKLLAASGAAAAATTAVAAPAIAQSMPEVKWRMTSSFPKQLDVIYGAALVLAKAVGEATDGRFQIQSFAAGEIAPGLQALDVVQSGSVECAQTPVYFYTGKDPVLAFGTGTPFGLNARQQHAWWHHGGGAEIINASLAKFNAIGFPAGNSGTQMGGFFRKEINSVDDLKGLKFRIGGLGGQVLAKLGVVPQNIAPGDLYPALERGTIDAAEFTVPADDEKLGLHRVAKYYYYPGWWEGGAMMHVVVGLDAWNKLPKHYQAIFQACAELANNNMISRFDALNPAALRRMIGQGAELRAFSMPLMETSLKAANELYAEMAEKNENFKKALDSYNSFRGESLLWWQIGDFSFDNFMVRTKGRA
ncbi:MAG: ABC transporter substrate-binding protein [Rhizobiales bacterium 65-9]|nr:TRAP transporter substrate-binding protein DctP [Hyphomicrobiales bacterium]OJY33223.1 MAG: ABC transporter substrate-binding protein [Rhizobiales bacterium 65-9]